MASTNISNHFHLEQKLWRRENGFHYSKNLIPLVRIKDFVEIQYSVLWKLCFDRSYFRLVETINEIRGKQFSKKELILASGQLIFWLVETIFLLYFSKTPASFFSV